MENKKTNSVESVTIWGMKNAIHRRLRKGPAKKIFIIKTPSCGTSETGIMVQHERAAESLANRFRPQFTFPDETHRMENMSKQGVAEILARSKTSSGANSAK